MSHVSRRRVEETAAITAHLNRLFDGSDLGTLHRRLNDWSAGIPAGALDPDQLGRANRTDEHGAFPEHSDRTGDTATAKADGRDDATDYTDLLARYLRVSQAAAKILPVLASTAAELENVLPHLARSTIASTEEQKSATPDDNKIVAGNCVCCLRPVTRGQDVTDKDRMHMVEGEVMCGTHKRQRTKPKYVHMTIVAFVDSYAWRRGAA